ncbi:major allergen Pru ar 1-like [Eucalyptus grandis]|uniref:major allergen Pru ar 1-like n=1 Tax=Eucalyptus grandis TaxID=71139 RepID=UPI00192F0607|nr:major allergen Pru ar 1-like [Eucalyptus grandis]
MGVITFHFDILSPIPPASMFKAAILDADNLLPMVLPRAVKSVEVLEGDGGPGTIKLMAFGEGSQNKTAKHKVEVLDKENFTYCYSITRAKCWAPPLRKSAMSYFTNGDVDVPENEIKAGKQKVTAMVGAIQAYLVANPDAY